MHSFKINSKDRPIEKFSRSKVNKRMSRDYWFEILTPYLYERAEISLDIRKIVSFFNAVAHWQATKYK